MSPEASLNKYIVDSSSYASAHRVHTQTNVLQDPLSFFTHMQYDVTEQGSSTKQKASTNVNVQGHHLESAKTRTRM